jgi:hypothetical protein
MMIKYDDPKWKEMQGGYRLPYDPTPALRKLESGTDVEFAWDDLWNNLHHQGDVGEASYAAVPHLVRIHKENCHLDWNLYALVSTIEIERHRKTNPDLPSWAEPEYREALETLMTCGLEDIKDADDPTTVQAILGAIALAKGSVKLGALISTLDESEADEYLDSYLGWSEIYR